MEEVDDQIFGNLSGEVKIKNTGAI